MDLALEIGLPVQVLAHVMTEREFRAWAAYRSARALPTRRLELYLAQIAQMIASTMGGMKNAKLSDFFIELEPALPEAEAEDVDVPALQAAFAYQPRRRMT